jgi:putative transposase
MKYNSEKQHRKSIRLKGYDYSETGLYFITMCCHNREKIFGEIRNGKMELNQLGEIANEEWEKTISIGDFIIMPNHFHAIIQIDYQIKNGKEAIGKFESPSQNIGALIRGYKGTTTKQINIIKNKLESIPCTGVLQYAPTPLQYAPIKKKSIWQRNYWEHIIRTEKEYSRISAYIRNNPQKWYNDKLNNGKGNIVLELQSFYGEEIWMI